MGGYPHEQGICTAHPRVQIQDVRSAFEYKNLFIYSSLFNACVELPNHFWDRCRHFNHMSSKNNTDRWGFNQQKWTHPKCLNPSLKHLYLNHTLSAPALSRPVWDISRGLGTLVAQKTWSVSFWPAWAPDTLLIPGSTSWASRRNIEVNGCRLSTSRMLMVPLRQLGHNARGLSKGQIASDDIGGEQANIRELLWRSEA